MRFIVTGASGFLGRNAVLELLKREQHEVVAVTSQPAELYRSRITATTGSSTGRLVHVLSAADLLATQDYLSDADVVLNCAFPWNRGGVAMADGLAFLMRLFSLSAGTNVATFVNVSSQSVYAQSRTDAAAENGLIECATPYATAKYALELAAEAILPPGILVNARMSSLIGPGYDVRVVNRFIRQILSGEALVIHGGDQVFDYMDVVDAANALILLGERGSLSSATVVNVGAGNPLPLREIVRRVAAVVEAETGIAADVRWMPSDGDVRRLSLDCDLFYSRYGFTPRVSFDESVRRILKAIRAELSNAGSDEVRS